MRKLFVIAIGVLIVVGLLTGFSFSEKGKQLINDLKQAYENVLGKTDELKQQFDDKKKEVEGTIKATQDAAKATQDAAKAIQNATDAVKKISQ